MRSQTWSEGACGRSANITRANRPRSANADVAGPRRQPMARRVGDADCSAPESSGCIIQVAKIARSLPSGMISVDEDRCSSPRINHIVSDAAMHSRLPQRVENGYGGRSTLEPLVPCMGCSLSSGFRPETSFSCFLIGFFVQMHCSENSKLTWSSLNSTASWWVISGSGLSLL
jgi:hypothetical protein